MEGDAENAASFVSPAMPGAAHSQISLLGPHASCRTGFIEIIRVPWQTVDLRHIWHVVMLLRRCRAAGAWVETFKCLKEERKRWLKRAGNGQPVLGDIRGLNLVVKGFFGYSHGTEHPVGRGDAVAETNPRSPCSRDCWACWLFMLSRRYVHMQRCL